MLLLRPWLLVATLVLSPFTIATEFSQDHQRLIDLAAKSGNGIINLDASTFDLLTSPKRTWSASIQLTANNPRRRCGPCKAFEPSWQALAKAWSSVRPQQETRNQHFFATLDFDEGPSVFTKLGLSSAPAVFSYFPTEGPRERPSGKSGPFKYDFAGGFEPGPLAEYLSAATPVAIPYSEPIDWAQWIMVAGSLAMCLLLFRTLLPFLRSKYLWATVVVIYTVINTTGFMFVRIKGVPYAAKDGNWIAAGFQNQFGQEVHVLAVMYLILGAAFLMLTLVIPSLGSPSRQRFQVYVWTAVIMLMFSMLVSLFRVKNRGYPFRLFL